jgi:hypothetical protein
VLQCAVIFGVVSGKTVRFFIRSLVASIKALSARADGKSNTRQRTCTTDRGRRKSCPCLLLADVVCRSAFRLSCFQPSASNCCWTPGLIPLSRSESECSAHTKWFFSRVSASQGRYTKSKHLGRSREGVILVFLASFGSVRLIVEVHEAHLRPFPIRSYPASL